MSMDTYDDRDVYNGDPEHDMYVDYDYQINTGEPVFDDEEYDDEEYDEEEDPYY